MARPRLLPVVSALSLGLGGWLGVCIEKRRTAAVGSDWRFPDKDVKSNLNTRLDGSSQGELYTWPVALPALPTVSASTSLIPPNQTSKAVQPFQPSGNGIKLKVKPRTAKSIS